MKDGLDALEDFWFGGKVLQIVEKQLQSSLID